MQDLVDSKILHRHLERCTARIVLWGRISQDYFKVQVDFDLIIQILTRIEDPVPARASPDIETDSLATQSFLVTFSHGTHTSTSFLKELPSAYTAWAPIFLSITGLASILKHIKHNMSSKNNHFISSKSNSIKPKPPLLNKIKKKTLSEGLLSILRVNLKGGPPHARNDLVLFFCQIFLRQRKLDENRFNSVR